MPYILLGFSIVLSVGRNILSKNLSDIRFGTRAFFACQSLLFACGCLALSIFGQISFENIAPKTLLYAFLYGLLLILAQWFYTAALRKGSTSLCSTVYSLGFILPTLSGALIWSERLSFLDILGIICAIAAVVVSGIKPGADQCEKKSLYFLPLIIAMLASGGLGIVQKMQQKSNVAAQKPIFLAIAFLLASTISLVFALLSKEQSEGKLSKSKLVAASCVGIFFGCCNLLNTSLAGMLDSAIFFPTLNLGVILLSMLCGFIFFKEKLAKRDVYILGLGVAAILLLNFG